ncbi:MAG: hypothetical protein ACI8ZM_001910 [Crocinitomix sp.]|jgi:hypothetical protein
MYQRIVIALLFFTTSLCYGQNSIVIMQEHYTYTINNLDDYVTEISLEGINFSDSKSKISIPFSELSTLENSASFELKNGKWKASKIDQKTSISTIDYSSFFSGYKYLLYEIPPSVHFKLVLTFKEKHCIFLSELHKTGKFGHTENVKYNFKLPNDLVLSSEHGEKLKGEFTYDFKKIDSAEVVHFLIHPQSTPPSSYFSTWFSKRIDSQLVIADSLIQAVLADSRQKLNDSIFVSACFEFVRRKIRYVDIENGINALIPRQCEKTLANRLGDCKDMATLLTAIYRHYGFEAYVAIAQTNDQIKPFNFPTIGLANHMICALKFKEQWYYLDPTENGCLFGDPSLQIFGTETFVVGSGPDYFQSIPSVTRHKSYGEMRYNFDEENQLISLHIVAAGKMNLLFDYINFNYNSPKIYLEKVLLNISQNKWIVDSLSITNYSSSIHFSLPLSAAMYSKIKDQTLYDPSAFLLSMPAMVSIFQNNETPLFDSQIKIKLAFNGIIGSILNHSSPIIESKDEKSITFKCPLKFTDNIDEFQRDSAYLSWQEFLKKPIIINHEN